jgi:hypothetical protein
LLLIKKNNKIAKISQPNFIDEEKKKAYQFNKMKNPKINFNRREMNRK